MNIYHNSQNIAYRSPFGSVPIGTQVTLTLSAPEGAEVVLRLWDGEETRLPMTPQGERYTASVTVPKEGCLLWYYFVVTLGEETRFYGNNSENSGGIGAIYDREPPSFQITVYEKTTLPEWYRNGIVYQIFPDRFFRGFDFGMRAAHFSHNYHTERKILEAWEGMPFYPKKPDGSVSCWNFSGGTLSGIEEKLPYLKSMGISAVYLNPIFKAASNHRYDTADYFSVDPLLGDTKDFVRLCRKARTLGIRILLDGVFNHTGSDSIYFDQYGTFGGSGRRPWYRKTEKGYDCWWGVLDLPAVDKNIPDYRDFICGKEGVLRHWLRLGASGWRLDVADELPDDFIEEIRTAVKAEGEDNLLIGEVWEDASRKVSYGVLRRYLLGRELDGTMHYPFRTMALDFICNRIPAEALCRKARNIQENYPPESLAGSLVLIDGHDRARAITTLAEREEISLPEQKDYHLSDWDYAIGKKRLKMLSTMQYAWPGVPCLYYGDEAGMQGHTDPYNRAPFPWGNEDGELLYHYRMLGLVRREHPALTDGDFLPFCEGKDIFGFFRKNGQETLLYLVNRSYTETYSVSRPVEGSFALELLTSREATIESGKLQTELAPLTAKLFLLQKQAPCIVPLKRGAGVLCHISSIPGGTLGKPARNFVDYLISSGMTLWQILPLNPVGLGGSPYHSPSVFAGNTALLDLNELPNRSGLRAFQKKNAYWLDPYCRITGEDPYLQYCFFTQWQELKNYANKKGIYIIGDLPIYAAPDSIDVKAHPEVFQKNNHAGVPPDYFSPTGQDWGNPLYDWEAMNKDGYTWWMERLKCCRERYDYTRMDHFRSFSEYYAIPDGKKAVDGNWRKGPGLAFFRTIEEEIGSLNLIAEDLGSLDNGVFNLLKLTGLPGMHVWQFSKDEMLAMPPEEATRRIFYSGTHDNQTLLSWYEGDREKAEEAIKQLYASPAPWVILPLQDVLLLDDRSRMNTPGTCGNKNWIWRVKESKLTKERAMYFSHLAKESGR